MKRFALTLLLVVIACSMSSCATTHLWRWGLGYSSAVHKMENDRAEAFVKPASTVFGTPIAIAWDAATLPLQLIFWVYPIGDRFMVPDQADV